MDTCHAATGSARAMKRGAASAVPIVASSATTPTDTDAALMARVTSGDRAALAALYDRHARVAYSLATRLVGASAAEDIVQDAFVGLVERGQTFAPERGAFRSWFLATVHHRCVNVLRGANRATGDDALAAVADDAPEPAEAVVRSLEDAAVRQALGRLPEAQQEVLALAYFGGLSQSALAARLQTPLGTIKARMRRGLVALRSDLAGLRVGPGEEAAP